MRKRIWRRERKRGTHLLQGETEKRRDEELETDRDKGKLSQKTIKTKQDKRSEGMLSSWESHDWN